MLLWEIELLEFWGKHVPRAQDDTLLHTLREAADGFYQALQTI